MLPYENLELNTYFSAMIKRDLEVPGEVPAKNGFRAKDTDDCRILSPISKPGNFYPTKIGGSKDACFLIGECIPEIAVWRFAIGHQALRNNQIAIKAGIKKRLNRFSAFVEDNGDGNIGEMSARKCFCFAHSHLPMARSPILKMKLPGPNFVFACCMRSKTVSATSVLPSCEIAIYFPR